MYHNEPSELHRKVFRLFVIAVCGLGLVTCAPPLPSALAAGETFKAPIPKPAGQPSQQPPQKVAPASQAVALPQGGKKPEKPEALNFEVELKRLNALINLQDHNAEALFNRAWLYQSRGDLARDDLARDDLGMAEKDYSRVITIEKQNKDAYYNRGLVYTKMNKHAEAVRDFSEVVRLDPGAADAYCNRGNAYMRLGKADLAVKDYDAAIKAKPNDADLYFNRGLAHLSTGAKTKAMEDFKSASGMGHPNANKYLKQ
jgi:tetratricopeptide (TPR) repeat protein